MKRSFWGIGGPALASAVLLLVVSLLGVAPVYRRSVGFGLAVAWAQSLVSTFAIRSVWRRKNAFLAVWTAGFFFRLAVVLIGFFWLRGRTDYHLLTGMGTMIAATAFFLIAETLIVLDAQK